MYDQVSGHLCIMQGIVTIGHAVHGKGIYLADNAFAIKAQKQNGGFFKKIGVNISLPCHGFNFTYFEISLSSTPRDGM